MAERVEVDVLVAVTEEKGERVVVDVREAVADAVEAIPASSRG